MLLLIETIETIVMLEATNNDEDYDGRYCLIMIIIIIMKDFDEFDDDDDDDDDDTEKCCYCYQL